MHRARWDFEAHPRGRFWAITEGSRGAETFRVEFGSPVIGTTTYALCVYDESATVPALPFAAAIMRPVASDRRLPRERRTRLDRLCAAVTKALDELTTEAGLKAA